MFAGLWAGREAISLKVVLNGAETRLIDATPGTSSCLTSGFSTFVQDVALRCGRPIESTLSYKDGEGDVITVSTDGEFEGALKAGITRFDATTSVRSFEDSGGGGSRPHHHPATPTVWTSDITFWVNGELVTVSNPDPAVTLLDWLRESKVGFLLPSPFE
jgi:hypothetical protein